MTWDASRPILFEGLSGDVPKRGVFVYEMKLAGSQTADGLVPPTDLSNVCANQFDESPSVDWWVLPPFSLSFLC